MARTKKPLRVVVGSAKGGVGKTTIAAHLAAALKATLIDLDPEGSTRAMTGHDLDVRYTLPELAADERLVLDVPANTSNNAARLNRAVQQATHVLIPVRSGDLELDRLENTLTSIRGHVPAATPVGVVLNFARDNAITRETLEALEYLAGQSAVPYRVVGALPDRVAFQRAMTNGFKRTLDLPDFQDVVKWVRK